jgi:crotonobetaine/carnitine-CoA ligase
MKKSETNPLVLGDLLDARVASHGTATFVKLRDGELTFTEVKETADRMAGGFASLGVDYGDHVAVMLPNGPDILHVTFALARLGAVMVPINTAYQGEVLRHVLRTSDARILVVEEALVERIDGLELPNVESLVVRRGNAGTLGALDKPAVPLSRLLEGGGDPPRPLVHPHSLQAIMYTSGTTGPSKGVMVSHALALTCAIDSVRFVQSGGRTIYCPLPLFHAAGLWDSMMSALWSGGSIAVVERFSASRFWEDVRRFGAAVAMGVFSMIPILLAQPRCADDRDHPLETFYMGKSALDADFFERFGVHTVETYTSTEIGIGTASPYGEWRTGSCGRAHAERYEVQVVDDADRALGPGQPGELVVRPKQPWVMFSGYYGSPDATARSFRNLWFHTGDRAQVDDDGYFYFLDRIKDAIRRRGENISAFEIERAINAHPCVVESAAFGVPSELQEEEVAVALVLQPGEVLSPPELVSWCESHLPSFMIPRFVEVVGELPRSSTGKLAKHELRARGDHGITRLTWDRERVIPERTA